jgi:hypothetical protein
MGSPSLFCNRFSTKGRTLRTVRLFDEATLRSGGAGLARVFDFSLIRSTLSRSELEKLDDRVTAARRHADTRPHRYLPRRGATAREIRAGMTVVDKLRDRETPRL